MEEAVQDKLRDTYDIVKSKMGKPKKKICNLGRNISNEEIDKCILWVFGNSFQQNMEKGKIMPQLKKDFECMKT